MHWFGGFTDQSLANGYKKDHNAGMKPRFSTIDNIILQFDSALRAMAAKAPEQRVSPAHGMAEPELSPTEQRHSAGLMRVNHTGEICAQALYEGQLSVSREPETTAMLAEARDEELDHLAWTHSAFAGVKIASQLFKSILVYGFLCHWPCGRFGW